MARSGRDQGERVIIIISSFRGASST